MKIFADDVAIYKIVVDPSDCHVLQEDLAHIFDWTVAWQVRGKCEALNISNKRALIQLMEELFSGNPLFAIWGFM